jgi:hypothetical protein
LSKRLGFSVRLPEHMCDGYTMQGCRLYRCACNCGHLSGQIIYGNGMDSVSVFETAALTHCGGSYCMPQTKCGPQACQISSSSEADVAVVSRADKTVVVVGHLSVSELMRIAQSTP